MSLMITFDLGRKDFTDQHPWDGTETERKQDDEHAHGCERNKTNGRDVVVVGFHVEEGADQHCTNSHDDN